MGKKERQRQILLGLVDYYIRTGKPLGSNTLREEGFEMLSAATIRNYFVQLEQEGFLQQQHISGGRLPTDAALRLYAAHIAEEVALQEKEPEAQLALEGLDDIEERNTRAVMAFLQQATESLSVRAGCAAFLSAPRFDQDFVTDLKFVEIDRERVLCVLITDFGAIQTEILSIPFKLSTFALKRLESYCAAKLHNRTPPELAAGETEVAENFYKELMVRYLMSYANFSEEHVFTSGVARLLSAAEFQEPKALAGSLALFEDLRGLRLLSQECCRQQRLAYWLGDDLIPYGSLEGRSAVLASPYRLHSQPVGAIGLLGATRQPYRDNMTLLKHYSQAIGEALTGTLYKYKITYRQPKQSHPYLASQPLKLLETQESHVYG